MYHVLGCGNFKRNDQLTILSWLKMHLSLMRISLKTAIKLVIWDIFLK